MKKIAITILVFLVAGYGYLSWDHYVAEYKFEQYCQSGMVGQFAYEKVALGDEYIQKLEAGEKPKDFDSRFLLENGAYINPKKFEQDYLFEPYKRSQLSSIGPIETVESSVTRKADNKLLSKAVAVRNYRGKFIQWSATSSPGYITCPSTYRKTGLEISEYDKQHDQLVVSTFKSEQL